jgi:hypothetical protein
MATRTLDRRPIPWPFRMLGWLVLGAVALAMISVAAVIGAGTYYEFTRTKAGDMDGLIEKELPRGVTTEHILADLDSRGIEHGPVEASKADDRKLLDAAVPLGTNVIHAIIRNDGYSLDLVDVHMRFILDEEGKLKDHIVWEVHHRP